MAESLYRGRILLVGARSRLKPPGREGEGVLITGEVGNAEVGTSHKSVVNEGAGRPHPCSCEAGGEGADLGPEGLIGKLVEVSAREVMP